MPFKVLFHHMQEITILRYRGHKVIDLEPWMLPLFDINQEKLYFSCCIQELIDRLRLALWIQKQQIFNTRQH